MRSIIHISDLHFGNEDPALVEALLADIEHERPTLVAVSGELTQRARRDQFVSAGAFLQRLPVPWIAVPGNHDIPLYDPYRRFVRPMRRFQRHVSADLAPLYADGEIAVVGLNSARSNVFKKGRVSVPQIETLRLRLSAIGPHVLKVLVVHHPFVAHPDEPRHTLIGRGRELLEVASQAGLDLILSGHTHLGYGDDVRSTYEDIQRSILVFQAGTAVSRARRGGESNSYNLVTADRPRLTLEVRAWDGEGFVEEMRVAFRRQGQEWMRSDEDMSSRPGRRYEGPDRRR